MIDLDIWEEHIRDENIESVMVQYDNPAIFQNELKDLINNYLSIGDEIIEIGCELAGTTYLLRDDVKKYLLDYNKHAISLAKAAFKSKGKNIEDCYVMDMFNMNMKGKKFDLIYNAGVLEHYNLDTRRKAIEEYEKILKPGGKMILAIPNHYSVPYRIAYLFLRTIGKWRFPSEEKIYDFSIEIKNIKSLSLVERKILSKKSVFDWFNFFKPLKLFFIFLDKVFKFEGYLTVIVLEKSG